MGDSSGPYVKLPPGWDCKYDQATGNCYYINYFTKAMQLEDPRMRYKQLQNERCSTESIPLQPVHGSPYHVYPSNNYPAVRAFQGPTNEQSLHNLSSSPLLSTKSHLEMSPLPFAKSSAPQTPRMGNMSRRSTIQETSFTNQIDTDAVVAKIQNMFPTAGENHIRLLLKRYYNREAVVISALQVEKHPVTMPGPFVTPPAQRHLFHSNSAFHMTPPARRLDIGTSRALGGGGSVSRTASPVPGGRFGSVMSMHSGHSAMGSGVGVGVSHGMGGAPGVGVGVPPTAAAAAIYGHLPFHGSPRFGEQIRSSPKPHSSPKMKLRYMKTIFPKADETLLLDILANSDNNVQMASEKLIGMGYVKRDFVPPKVSNRPELDAEGRPKRPDDEKHIPLRPKEYTEAEKEAMKLRLKEKYSQIAERIILMALESVNYSEDRAMQILQIVHEEDETREKKLNEAHKAKGDEHQQQQQRAGVTTTDGLGASTSAAAAMDNILTVVLETTTTTPNANRKNGDNDKQTMNVATKAGKQRLLPSINVTTPSTMTTQIILSHSNHELNEILNRTQQHNSNEQTKSNKKQLEKSSASKSFPPSASTSSQLPSSSSISQSYQTITTKSILERSQTNETGISGYLQKHGCTPASTNNTTSTTMTNNNNTSDSILDKLKLSRSRDKTHSLKNSSRDSTEEDPDMLLHQDFKSILGRIATMGPNTELAKGPDDSLLLADYVTWNGANPDISVGHKQAATGPNGALLGERNYMAVGRNPDLCKGPKSGLAKGSIYAQLATGGAKSANIKCN